MYSLPSASQIRAPCPRTMNGASHSTALKARTGELTPPGISFAARECRRRDSSSFRGIILLPRREPRVVHPHYVSLSLAGPALAFHGEFINIAARTARSFYPKGHQH